MKRMLLVVILMLTLGVLSGMVYYHPAEAAHCVPCCTVNVSQNECCESSGGACIVYPCDRPPKLD
jgi:hypothetical protein